MDQTILHAELITNVDLAQTIPESIPDLYHFSAESENFSYLVKFRPGVKEFFIEVSKKYEITVYTAGQHSYALAIVKLIRTQILRDLTEQERLKILPDRRVISRDISGNGSFKDLRKVFPHDQSLVVILDDRKDVWPGCEESLINIRRCTCCLAPQGRQLWLESTYKAELSTPTLFLLCSSHFHFRGPCPYIFFSPDEFLDQKESRLSFPPVGTEWRVQHEAAVKSYKEQHPEWAAEETKRRLGAVTSRIKDLLARMYSKLAQNEQAFESFLQAAVPNFDTEETALWNRVGLFGGEAQKATSALIDACLMTADCLSHDATLTAHHQLGAKSSKATMSDAVLRELVCRLVDGVDFGTWKQQDTLIQAAGSELESLHDLKLGVLNGNHLVLVQFLLVYKKLCRAGWASALGDVYSGALLVVLFGLDKKPETSSDSPPAAPSSSTSSSVTKGKKRTFDQVATSSSAAEQEADPFGGGSDVSPPAKRQKTDSGNGNDDSSSSSSDESMETAKEEPETPEPEQLLFVARLGRFSRPVAGFTIRYFEDAVTLDRCLWQVTDLMNRVHARFYPQLGGGLRNPNTSRILPSIKKRCLQGVGILFTGVFPTNIQPHRHHLWIEAVEHGARCFTDFNQEVTHVVAGLEGTDKCVEASKRDGVFLVHRDWLEASFLEFKRAPEYDYGLSNYPVAKSEPAIPDPAYSDDEEALDGAVALGEEEEVPEFFGEDDEVPSLSEESAKENDEEDFESEMKDKLNEDSLLEEDHVKEPEDFDAPEVESGDVEAIEQPAELRNGAAKAIEQKDASGSVLTEAELDALVRRMNAYLPCNSLTARVFKAAELDF